MAGCGVTHGSTASSSPASTTTSTASSTTTSAPPPATTAPGTAAQWTTYGGNFSRTSLDATFPAVTTAPAPVWTSPVLDGGVYGEPLVYGGQVLVATENDTVYALSAASGKIQWSDHVATPAPAGALPCGDITPTVGITSTMVIDPATDTVFASAETEAKGAVGHEVVGIDLSTHEVVWSRDVDQPRWTASAQLQRTGLGLSDGRVVVGFGGNEGDCGQYHGWVVAVPETGSGPTLSYQVPTTREGAVWAPAGVTVDPSGDVYVATGNGAATAGQPFDHGDAVIELSPALAELSYFAPTNWAQDNADDGDLGSTAPILLDGGQVFEVGKQTTAVYVVCPGDGEIAQVRIGHDSMQRGWTWTSPTGGASSPTIAGGVVWSVDLSASTLYGIDEASGATRFALPLHVGTPEHFAAPTVAGAMIVVAGSSAVEAFR
jgi:hypothetical protein